MTTKKDSTTTPLSPDEAKDMEAAYRAGVDISIYELADKFEADGYDWKQALKDCGYSDKRIADEVEKVTPRKPAKPKPEPEE